MIQVAQSVAEAAPSGVVIAFQLIGAIAPAVSALAATFSATIALRAARLNKAAQDDLRRSRLISTRSDLYRHQVAEPLRTYVRVFAEETARLLKGALNPDVPADQELRSEAETRARELISDVKEHWRAAGAILMAGAEAWDPSLFDRLDTAREQITDCMTKLVDLHMFKRTSGGEADLACDALIHEHTVIMLTILKEFEPSLVAAAAAPQIPASKPGLLQRLRS